MSQGGKLTITAAIVSVPEKEGEFLKISFQDTGSGIPPQNLERIFERYFTTKEGGSGLGLAVVDRVIKAHNGLVKVESKPGRGTDFQIFLPLT
jgi:signal transduction histidine kinase